MKAKGKKKRVKKHVFVLRKKREACVHVSAKETVEVKVDKFDK